MWFSRFWQGSLKRPQAQRRVRVRLTVESLEDRAVPANFTAGNVPELIAAIDAANQSTEADIIALVPGTTFTLTEVNYAANGPTGLPVIAANGGDLTIVGNGAIIERSTAAPGFRLFDVAPGASLALDNLTLQGGRAINATLAGWAMGGAIHSQGTLTLRGVVVQNNVAWGSGWSVSAAGGGIYSSGTLTLENSIIQNNLAHGEDGDAGSRGDCRDGRPGGPGEAGGDAFGGGLYVGAGTAILIGVTFFANTAEGGTGGEGGPGCHSTGSGRGGDGGDGSGGGLYAAGGSVTLRNSSATENNAKGAVGGKGGRGAGSGSRGVAEGGGLYIEADALACLDAFTESHVKRNRPSNIFGSYIICS